MLNYIIKKTITPQAKEAFAHRFQPELSLSLFQKVTRLSRMCRTLQQSALLETVKTAHSLQDYNLCRELLYRSLLEQGVVRPTTEHRFFNAQLCTPHSTLLFTQKRKNKCAIQIVKDSEYGLPSEDILEEELAYLRSEDYHLVEITPPGLGDGDNYIAEFDKLSDLKTLSPLISLLVKAFNHAYQFSTAPYLLVIVPEEQRCFYEYIGFKQFAPEKNAPYKKRTLVPMMLNMNKFLDSADKHIPAFFTLSNLEIMKEEFSYLPDSHELQELLETYPEYKEVLEESHPDFFAAYYPDLRKQQETPACDNSFQREKETGEFQVDRLILLEDKL